MMLSTMTLKEYRLKIRRNLIANSFATRIKQYNCVQISEKVAKIVARIFDMC